jgi:hypothetical protein
LRRDAGRGGEEPEGVDQRCGEEHGTKGGAKPWETGKGDSESARGWTEAEAGSRQLVPTLAPSA